MLLIVWGEVKTRIILERHHRIKHMEGEEGDKWKHQNSTEESRTYEGSWVSVMQLRMRYRIDYVEELSLRPYSLPGAKMPPCTTASLA